MSRSKHSRSTNTASRKLRIVQLTNTLARADGGPAKNAFELHQAFNARIDCRAAMLVMSRKTGASPKSQVYSEDPSNLRGGSVAGTLTLPRTLKILLSADIVVIHGYYLWWTPIAATTSRALGNKVFVTPHGSLTEYQQKFSPKRKWLFDNSFGLILRQCITAFVLGSEREAHELKKKFPKKPAVVAGVGTDLPETPWTPVAEDDRENAPVQLLSLSRIAPKKRLDLSLQTLNHLRQRGIAAHLTVAGEGETALKEALQKQIAHDGLSDYVSFVGEVAGAAKRELFSNSDVFLAPSDDENFGISVAEALAHGLGCVVSTYVASADGLTPPAGVVLESREPRVIADAVQLLLDRPKAVRSAAAQAFASGHFSWSSVAQRWMIAFTHLE